MIFFITYIMYQIRYVLGRAKTLFTFLISDVVVATISYELNQIGWGLGILAPSPGLVESKEIYMALEAKMLK